MMTDISVVNAFNYCRSVLLKESNNSNESFFKPEDYCLPDTRDANFEKTENRLAYIHRYGVYNILFIEKCTSNFIEQNNAEALNVFASKDLSICSLSNGPGIDIVGLLLSVFNSSLQLNGKVSLSVINPHKSWKDAFEKFINLICSTTSKFQENLSTENINFIHSDIYASITPEVLSCIQDANILLMQNVFSSSKATKQIFTNTLKEIFSILRPGALVFFVGPKKRTKNMLADNFAKCLFGPCEIKLEIATQDQNMIIPIKNVKPNNAGQSFVIVWKKTINLVQNPSLVIKKARTRRSKRKKKSLYSDDVINDNSEISLTASSSTLSETSSNTGSELNVFESTYAKDINYDTYVGDALNKQSDTQLSTEENIDKQFLLDSNNEKKVVQTINDDMQEIKLKLQKEITKASRVISKLHSISEPCLKDESIFINKFLLKRKQSDESFKFSKEREMDFACSNIKQNTREKNEILSANNIPNDLVEISNKTSKITELECKTVQNRIVYNTISNKSNTDGAKRCVELPSYASVLSQTKHGNSAIRNDSKVNHDVHFSTITKLPKCSKIQLKIQKEHPNSSKTEVLDKATITDLNNICEQTGSTVFKIPEYKIKKASDNLSFSSAAENSSQDFDIMFKHCNSLLNVLEELINSIKRENDLKRKREQNFCKLKEHIMHKNSCNINTCCMGHYNCCCNMFNTKICENSKCISDGKISKIPSIVIPIQNEKLMQILHLLSDDK